MYCFSLQEAIKNGKEKREKSRQKTHRKTQAQFNCVVCNYKNHADIIGAMNVLERGYRLLARGEMVHLGRSMKQEPAEVSQCFN